MIYFVLFIFLIYLFLSLFTKFTWQQKFAFFGYIIIILWIMMIVSFIGVISVSQLVKTKSLKGEESRKLIDSVTVDIQREVSETYPDAIYLYNEVWEDQPSPSFPSSSDEGKKKETDEKQICNILFQNVENFVFYKDYPIDIIKLYIDKINRWFKSSTVKEQWEKVKSKFSLKTQTFINDLIEGKINQNHLGRNFLEEYKQMFSI